MMGLRKASEIKQALREALARDRHHVEAWLDEEFAKLRPAQRRDPKVVQDLHWIRDTLR